MASYYLLRVGGTPEGPISKTELCRMAEAGHLSPDDQVSPSIGGPWTRIRRVAQLAERLQHTSLADEFGDRQHRENRHGGPVAHPRRPCPVKVDPVQESGPGKDGGGGEGPQTGDCTKARSNRTPMLASLSMFGVLSEGCPVQDR
jgi:hypothetical protein